MDRSYSNRVVLALLVICSALLVTPALGVTPPEIVAWGNDQFGQVSQAPTGTGYTAVAAMNDHSLALKADGSIVSWGDDSLGEVSQTPSGTGYTAVAAGSQHSLALKADGSIVSWGDDSYGQVSKTPAGTGYTAVAAGVSHSLALKADGSIIGWGNDRYAYGDLTHPPAGTGYTAIASGDYHSLALRADGSIVSWGRDWEGQVSQTPAGTGYTAIAAGGHYSVALRADGSIIGWGSDYLGQVSQTPSGTGYTAVAAGVSHSLALKADGSIIGWGDDSYGQVSQTPAGTGYTAVAAGGSHSLALLQPLVPDFTASPVIGMAPLTVQFTDQTTGGQPLSWSWDFGDGGHSVLTSPSHTYTAPGFYDVTLTVTNVASGSRSKYRGNYINVVGPLLPDFTGAPRIGYAPLSVQFTDRTPDDPPIGTIGGVPEAWTWYFGDGGSSLLQNPSHTYANPGTYRVTLQVSNMVGSNGTTKYNYIRALPLAGPFTIQAEDYDEGGEGVAYHDTTATNEGGVYRADGVDIEAFERGYVVSRIWDGEWTQYTIPSAAAVKHDYNLTLRVATRTSGEQVTVEVDGTDRAVVDLPNTGFLTTYVDVPARVTLHPGTNTVRFTFNGDYTNVDYFVLDPGKIDPLQTVQGGAGIPTDPDSDGKFDDVNGNGRPDFADVVLYFTQMGWIAANEPVAAFDYNANGRIDFADVVWLFNHL